MNIIDDANNDWDKQKGKIRKFKKIDYFLNDKKGNDRYSSFDYCYNYFYNFYKNNEINKIAIDENLEKSCLQLGFYLSSWGMMRGSSFLLKKSVKIYKKLLTEISKLDKSYFEIDIDNYNDENIDKLIYISNIIKYSFDEKDKPTDTLITKIMLGIFGNTPAFDRYFKKGMNIGGFNKKNLLKIKEFYDENKYILDDYNIKTLDFNTGLDTDIKYKKAKIVDMYGFMNGF